MLANEIKLPYKPNTKKLVKNYIMGIDPDIDSSGVAVWSRLTDGYLLLEKMDFAKLMDTILYYSPDELLIVVESGHENKSVWHLPSKCGNRQAAEIGRRVGINHATGIMIQSFCKANQYEVQEYVPNTPKWDANLFKAITGLGKGYNPEIRDAVRCIHGR